MTKHIPLIHHIEPKYLMWMMSAERQPSVKSDEETGGKQIGVLASKDVCTVSYKILIPLLNGTFMHVSSACT